MHPLLHLIMIPLLAVSSVVSAEVFETELDNGLRILVKPDHRAPIVVSQVWYKVGSSYEHDGLTGISHVLEHMMFKGTENLAPGEFSRIIAANGGKENAFTGRDYTGYYQQLASDRLAISMKLEADRMRHLLLQPEEFAKEVEVVKEERRLRTEDKPESLTYERFNAAAFQVSPYRNPVIGWMTDLDNLDIDELKQWYRRWYAPNNALLVVVGDVEPDQVVELAKQYFGPLPAEIIDPPKVRQEPPPLGEQRLVVRRPAREPYLLMGYKTPVLATIAPENDWEPYALEMLAAVLDGGSSARLSKELVRGRQIAVSADAGYSAYNRLSDMLLLDGSPAPGHSIAELETALREQIKRLQTELVSAEELERVRKQTIAAKIYQRDSVFSQAMQIGRLEVVGLSWQLADEVVERLQAVTPEQVQAVARKYLIEDRLTVATLDPLPIDSAQTAQQDAGVHHVH